MEDLQPGGLDDRVESVIGVLVDEDQSKALVRLELECGQEVLELLHASDRRDDEVERRKLLVHAP